MNTSASATSILRLIATSACAALTLSLATVSYAAGAPDERSVTVEFDAASASTPQGAGTLYRRIRVAAQDVCSVLEHGDLPSQRHFRACVRMTIEEAVKKVNRQPLSAAYDADYPPVPAGQVLAGQDR